VLTRRPAFPAALPRRTVCAALAGAALAAVGVASHAAATTIPSGCGALATAMPLELAYPGPAPDAGPLLRRLAVHLHPRPADAQSGAFAFNELGMQAADSVLGTPCPQTQTVYALEQRWRADDGSGEITATPWHHDPADPPPAVTSSYPPGELSGVVDGPVPTDPAALAAALDAAYPQPGPVTVRADAVTAAARSHGAGRSNPGRVRGIAALNEWHYTNLAARRAALTVLANVDGVTYRGQVTGYPGVAVSVDVGDWRDVLVVDPQTGGLIVAEQVLLRGGGPLGVATPYSMARTRFVDQGRSSVAGVMPAATLDRRG
jgi:hypothetical protein